MKTILTLIILTLAFCGQAQEQIKPMWFWNSGAATNDGTQIRGQESVAYKTNVTERFPGESVGIGCPDNMPGCLVYNTRFEPHQNPKEKWVDHEIVRVTTLSFDWRGKRQIENVEVLTNWTEHFVLKEQWENKTTNQPPATNAVRCIEMPITIRVHSFNTNGFAVEDLTGVYRMAEKTGSVLI